MQRVEAVDTAWVCTVIQAGAAAAAAAAAAVAVVVVGLEQEGEVAGTESRAYTVRGQGVVANWFGEEPPVE